VIEREFAILSMLWLLQRRGNGRGNGILSISNSKRNHKASLSACERAMYSASVEDNTVVRCLIADQATRDENMKNA